MVLGEGSISIDVQPEKPAFFSARPNVLCLAPSSAVPTGVRFGLLIWKCPSICAHDSIAVAACSPASVIPPASRFNPKPSVATASTNRAPSDEVVTQSHPYSTGFGSMQKVTPYFSASLASERKNGTAIA